MQEGLLVWETHEQASRAKRDSIAYFKKNGTLKGFEGPENLVEGINKVFLEKKIM